MYPSTLHRQMYPSTWTDVPKYMDRCVPKYINRCTHVHGQMGIIDMSIIMNDRNRGKIFNNVEQNYFCIGIMFQSTSHKQLLLKRARSDPNVIKLFSCSSQLNIKLKLLIKTKTLSKIGIPCF